MSTAIFLYLRKPGNNKWKLFKFFACSHPPQPSPFSMFGMVYVHLSFSLCFHTIYFYHVTSCLALPQSFTSLPTQYHILSLSLSSFSPHQKKPMGNKNQNKKSQQDNKTKQNETKQSSHIARMTKKMPSPLPPLPPAAGESWPQGHKNRRAGPTPHWLQHTRADPAARVQVSWP